MGSQQHIVWNTEVPLYIHREPIGVLNLMVKSKCCDTITAGDHKGPRYICVLSESQCHCEAVVDCTFDLVPLHLQNSYVAVNKFIIHSSFIFLHYTIKLNNMAIYIRLFDIT